MSIGRERLIYFNTFRPTCAVTIISCPSCLHKGSGRQVPNPRWEYESISQNKNEKL